MNTRCQSAWPCCIALLLSAMQTFVRPRAFANANACLTIRFTPLNVFSSSWIAISSSVPALKRPPMLT